MSYFLLLGCDPLFSGLNTTFVDLESQNSRTVQGRLFLKE